MLLPFGNGVIVNQRLRRGDTLPGGRFKKARKKKKTMKTYELMTIAKGKLTEESARSLSNSTKDLISTNGSRVLNSNFWGKRRFAYEIKGATEGWYDVVQFEADESVIAKLKQKLNIIDDLVRYIVINLTDESVTGGKDGKKS